MEPSVEGEEGPHSRNLMGELCCFFLFVCLFVLGFGERNKGGERKREGKEKRNPSFDCMNFCGMVYMNNTDIPTKETIFSYGKERLREKKGRKEKKRKEKKRKREKRRKKIEPGRGGEG